MAYTRTRGIPASYMLSCCRGTVDFYGSLVKGMLSNTALGDGVRFVLTMVEIGGTNPIQFRCFKTAVNKHEKSSA